MYDLPIDTTSTKIAEVLKNKYGYLMKQAAQFVPDPFEEREFR